MNKLPNNTRNILLEQLYRTNDTLTGRPNNRLIVVVPSTTWYKPTVRTSNTAIPLADLKLKTISTYLYLRPGQNAAKTRVD